MKITASASQSRERHTAMRDSPGLKINYRNRKITPSCVSFNLGGTAKFAKGNKVGITHARKTAYAFKYKHVSVQAVSSEHGYFPLGFLNCKPLLSFNSEFRKLGIC